MVLVYFLAPGRMKNAVLLLGSLIFYGWGEPKYLPVMAAVILAGYLSARLIGTCQNKRQSIILLVAAVLLEIFPLIYCKYADFFIQNLNVLTGQKIPLLSIAMPLGISFYTFQVISYTVDVYRGDVPAQKNLLTFAAYVAMFPQLVAGPIVRYSDIRSQLENRMHSVEKCAYGIRRFVTGLSKKILIANVLGELIGQFQASEEKSVLFFWMYAVAFMLQIYFDFSGYSDMAVGLGAVFGFDFPENFRYPYCSASITEFWRRWHISLGAWFRDYLYIPLGGSHVKPVRWIFNIFLVWMATGFWHGAAWNFILWGLMYAVLLLIEKAWLLPYLKKHKIVGHLYVLFFVLIGFVLFDHITELFLQAKQPFPLRNSHRCAGKALAGGILVSSHLHVPVPFQNYLSVLHDSQIYDPHLFRFVLNFPDIHFHIPLFFRAEFGFSAASGLCPFYQIIYYQTGSAAYIHSPAYKP